MIRINESGLGVVDIQTRLLKLDFFSGLVSGLFDYELEEAVKAFQKSEGLVIDGIVGRNTKRSLYRATENYWGFLFIHCSATPPTIDLSGQDVADYHKKRKKWSRAGYSDVIRLSGKLDVLRSWDSDDLIGYWEYTFGVAGSTLLNRNARHVCYIGGIKDGEAYDTRTPDQTRTLATYIQFALLRNPKLIIAGHNQVQRKACPSFDVPKFLRTIGVSKNNLANWGKMYQK